MTGQSDEWVGHFAMGCATLITTIERAGAHSKLVASELRGLLDAFMRSPDCTDELLNALGRALKDAWVVEGANGEVFAIADDREQAEARVRQAEVYLDEALVHPAADRWVGDRMPIVARPISRVQRQMILADGTPVLERER